MKQPLIIGEIFWDRFPDGSIHLGGSALNFAWHLKGLGLTPTFISRVGADDYGRKFIGQLAQWGLDMDHLQVDQEHHTGIIEVVMDSAGKPTYISPSLSSLDYIEYEPAFDAFPLDSVMYHCSYILRNDVTRDTIAKLKSRGFPVFMDLNLRNPYWSKPLLDTWVRDLEYLKLSDEEFARFSSKADLSHQQQLEWLQDLMKERSIRNTIYTIGDKGSFWIEKDEVHFEPARRIELVNSVGAGDAYCAAILVSKSHGLSIAETMKKSAEFAAEICKLPGASSPEKEFYRNCREKIWSR